MDEPANPAIRLMDVAKPQVKRLMNDAPGRPEVGSSPRELLGRPIDPLPGA
jgi:hypothetical protein